MQQSATVPQLETMQKVVVATQALRSLRIFEHPEAFDPQNPALEANV